MARRVAGAVAHLEFDVADAHAVAVYLPMSYMVGGYTVFLPRHLVEQTSLSVEEGMRIALMGGVRSAVPVATQAVVGEGR